MNLDIYFYLDFQIVQYNIYLFGAFVLLSGLVAYYYLTVSNINWFFPDIRNVILAILFIVLVFLDIQQQTAVAASMFVTGPQKLNIKRTPNLLQLIIGILLLILLNNEKLELISTFPWLPTSLLIITELLIASGIGILPLGIFGEMISFIMVVCTTTVLVKYTSSENNIVSYGPITFKYKLSLQEKKEYADSLLDLNGKVINKDLAYNKILIESESYVEIKEKVINWLMKKQERSSIFDYFTSNGDTKMWLLLGSILLVGIGYFAIHYYFLSETTIAQGETLNLVDKTLIEQGNLNNDAIKVSQSLANTIRELGVGLQGQIDKIIEQLATYKGKQDLLITSASQNSEALTEMENNLVSVYNLLASLRAALAKQLAINLPEIPEDVPEIPGRMILLGFITCKNYISYRNMYKSVTQTIESIVPLVPAPKTSVTLFNFSPKLGVTLPNSLPGFTRKFSTTKIKFSSITPKELSVATRKYSTERKNNILKEFFLARKEKYNEIYSRVKNVALSFIGYSTFEISDALLTSTLFLILCKLFWAFGETRPTLGVNLCILLCGFLLSLELEIAMTMREHLRLLLRNLLGLGFVLGQYVTTMIITNPIPTYARYFGHISHLSNIDFDADLSRYNSFFIAFCKFYLRKGLQCFYFFLIWLRLLIISQPVLFLCLNFFISSLLLTNKYFIFASLYSLIVWLSRMLFFISDYSLATFKANILPLFPELVKEGNMSIKPSWLNTKVVGTFCFYRLDGIPPGPDGKFESVYDYSYDALTTKLQLLGIDVSNYLPCSEYVFTSDLHQGYFNITVPTIEKFESKYIKTNSFTYLILFALIIICLHKQK